MKPIPTKIFRKTVYIEEMYKMLGVVIFFSIIGYFVYSVF